MGRIPDHKRIVKEDFNPDDQTLVEKLAFPINSFMEQVINLFNKNIDFTNLNQELIQFNISINNSGIISPAIKVKTELTKVTGMTCIRAINKTNSTTYPTSCPFITFTQDGNVLIINNITGLQNNSTYSLTFLVIG